ncbi:MAG: hypothetical protein RIT19_2265 [Verrucomicrobiota bacterium]|jgi:hypothetical protein
MNTFTSTSSIASPKPSPASLRWESLAFGLLLLGLCLPVAIPHASGGAEDPTGVTEMEHHPMETRLVVRDGAAADGSPVSVIGILPTVVISADGPGTPDASEPLPDVVTALPAVEIVPLAPLGSTTPIRP